MTDVRDDVAEEEKQTAALPRETSQDGERVAPASPDGEDGAADTAAQTDGESGYGAQSDGNGQPDGNFVEFAAPTHTTKDNGWAIAAFVLAFLFAPVGLILGIVGVIYSRKIDEAGKGLSIAAIVIGAVIIVAFALVCVLLVLLFRDMAIAIINGLQQSINEQTAGAAVELLPR